MGGVMEHQMHVQTWTSHVSAGDCSTAGGSTSTRQIAAAPV